jgi:ATP-dependent Clp protease ATP-binding subunit ClpC
MFEHCTERARRCIFFARQSASHRGSETIETEHLLLGILHEDPDVIGRFLPTKTAQDIRDEVEKRCTKKEASTRIEIPMSLHTKYILAYAAEEAERLFHRQINIDHFLTGVVREEDGVAGQILRSAGLNVVAMRQHLRATTHDNQSREDL